MNSPYDGLKTDHLPMLWTIRLPDGRRRLAQSITVTVLDRSVTVPKGAVTDYSSIPSFASWIVRWSKVDVAGVVHDWIYRYPDGFTRRQADYIWYDLALRGGANVLQAGLCYLGLRVGGWAPWRRLRKQTSS